MNKNKVKGDIRCIDLWIFDGLSIVDAKRTFDELLGNIENEDHWDNIHIEVNYVDDQKEMWLVGMRDETDREYKFRMKELRKADEYQAKIKERELKQLARLKKKYEK